MADDDTTPKGQAEETKTRAAETANKVKAKTSEAAEKTQQHVSGAAKEVKQQAEHVASEARESASTAKDSVKDKVRSQAHGAKERVQAEAEKGFEQGKNRVVTQVRSVAQAFRKTGEQLRQEDQNDLAGYSERIADQVDKVSGYLDDKGLRGTLGDLEGFARQRPGLFVGGALAVGLVAARFLRSSGSGSRR